MFGNVTALGYLPIPGALEIAIARETDGVPSFKVSLVQSEELDLIEKGFQFKPFWQ